MAILDICSCHYLITLVEEDSIPFYTILLFFFLIQSQTQTLWIPTYFSLSLISNTYYTYLPLVLDGVDWLLDYKSPNLGLGSGYIYLESPIDTFI